MFCSGCGSTITPGQSFCPQCGRVSPPPVPPVPTLAFELEQYSSRISTLGAVWLIYAGLTLALTIGGLLFARSLMSGNFPFWGGPFGPWGFHGFPFFGPAFFHFVWMISLVRVALLAAAGWGLREHATWARPVAIVAAIFSLVKFPFGTALAIWTLIVLLGYRNRSLYDQL